MCLLSVVVALWLVGCGGVAEGSGGVGGQTEPSDVVADAGPDQVVEEGSVVRIESRELAERYLWEQIGGPPVALDGSNRSEVRFDAPWTRGETLAVTLRLTVTDDSRSALDTVRIRVEDVPLILFPVEVEGTKKRELFAARLDGSTPPLRLSSSPNASVIQFEASPTGRFVAYVVRHDDRDTADVLFVAPTRGGDSVRITTEPRERTYVVEMLWSPRGDLLAYRSDRIVVADTTGREVGVLADLRDYRSLNRVQWSPTGDRVGFLTRVGDLDADLVLAAPDGSDRVNVVEQWAHDLWIVAYQWSPNGDRVAWLAYGESAPRELYTCDARGGDIARIGGELVKGRNVREFRWSPNGQWISFVAYDRVSNTLELFVATGAGSARKLSDVGPDGEVRDYEWSPDGESLAYRAVDGTHDTELRVVAVDGGASVSIVPGASALVVPRAYSWSPDSSSLAFIASEGSAGARHGLHVAAQDGTKYIKLSRPSIDDGNVREFAWTPTGDHVIYVAEHDNYDVHELYAVRSVGGDVIRLNGPLAIDGEVVEFAPGPRGARVAYVEDRSTTGRARLYSVALDGQRPTLIFEDLLSLPARRLYIE